MCGQIPAVWKSSSIIPIPKSTYPNELNDFRPVALTSLVMKTFEKLLKDEIVSLVFGKMDPLQFAHQARKSVDDAKIFILDRIFKHLEKTDSYARLLFAIFSSAFNKMLPHILVERLASCFNLPDQILLLLLNFLTDRTRQVFVNGHISKHHLLGYWLPAGLCPSPLAIYHVHRQLQVFL